MSGSDQVKGSAHRLIKTPGYHITSQYDMVHTRHILNEKRSKKKSFQLMLAPMVDMFSILVIYLIMNFSNDGEIFFVSKNVTIPKSSTGQPLKSLPLISVVGKNIFFDTSGGVVVNELNDEVVPRFREALRNIRKVEMQIGGEKAFKGEVNLQADEKTPTEEVKKIMRVLIEEGWTGINFVVTPERR